MERARFKVLELFSDVTLSSGLRFAVIVVAAHNEDMASFCEGETRRHSRIGDDAEADARGEERRDPSGDGMEERTACSSLPACVHASKQVLNSFSTAPTTFPRREA